MTTTHKKCSMTKDYNRRKNTIKSKQPAKSKEGKMNTKISYIAKRTVKIAIAALHPHRAMKNK